MDRPVLIVLRLLHVLGGIFWVGSIIFLAAFLLPAIRASGPDAGRLMPQLMLRQRLSLYLNAAGGITILSGIAMYAGAAMGTHGGWARSRPGIVFGIGGAAALVAMIVGGAVSRPVGLRMIKLGQETAASGAPPTPAVAAELQALQQRSTRSTQTIAILLLLAAAAMATARYF